MKPRTLAYIIAAFLAGGAVASFQLSERLDQLAFEADELRREANSLREENQELIYLLEEGR